MTPRISALFASGKTRLLPIVVTLSLSVSGCEWVAKLMDRVMDGHRRDGTPQLVLDRTEPPRIVPPSIPRNPIKTDVSRLPQGARAFLPAFDGDGFFVTIPTKSVPSFTAAQVYEDAVVPILSAIGFDFNGAPLDLRRDGRIKVPLHQGVKLPRASLKSLARATCRESPAGERSFASLICKALVSGKQVGAASLIDKTFKTRSGMSYEDYVSSFERLEIEYFFPQVHPNSALSHEQPVPIEHSGVLAWRREGQTISSVTGRVINRYKVTNTVTLREESAINERISRGLARVPRLCCWKRVLVSDQRPDLLLLEFGSADGVPALRYAYRVPITAEYERLRGHWYLWLDAETGEILRLQPLFHRAGVSAQGRAFELSPDRLPQTDLRKFEVDPAVNGQYVLQNSDLFQKFAGPIPAPTILDSKTGFADFDQFNVPTQQQVACRGGGSENFQYVDLMATLTWHIQTAVAAGLLSPFLNSQNKISVFFNREYESGCYPACSDTWAYLDFRFQKIDSANPASCQNQTSFEAMNSYNDHTIVAHELGHILTAHQYRLDLRQSSDNQSGQLWCSGGIIEKPSIPCPEPTGRELFHDFADAWANALEDTNCFAGWFGRHINCERHDPGDGLPRLADASGDSEDKDLFPDHRKISRGEYADMQIAAAALWEVRQGARSKDPDWGPWWHFQQFVRTLATTGWLGPLETVSQANGKLASTDVNVYRGLLDLEVKLLNQWLTSQAANPHSGSHTANKVTAGFAKAGIFLIPPVCLDSDKNTYDDLHCPQKEGGENGGDAVIDIDHDYLDKNASPPRFHVWTGPRYKFAKDETATSFAPSKETPSPCNLEYQIELANDPNFSVNLSTSTSASGAWLQVSPHQGNCEADWQPDVSAWKALTSGAGETWVYYRVRTRMGSGTTELFSTSPAKHTFEVAAPYAVVR